MNYLSEDNYQLSQEARLPVEQISGDAKKQYNQLLNQDQLTQHDLQVLATQICMDFDTKLIKVEYGGRQPHSRRNGRIKRKTHGDYNPGFQRIRLYKYTAVKKKVRATRSTLKTLLQELVQHFDFQIIGLNASPHTAGFYKRISQLKESLEG